MRNDNERTLDFYTSPQPTSYVKKERKKKSTTGGEAASAASVSIEEASCELPEGEATIKPKPPLQLAEGEEGSCLVSEKTMEPWPYWTSLLI